MKEPLPSVLYQSQQGQGNLQTGSGKPRMEVGHHQQRSVLWASTASDWRKLSHTPPYPQTRLHFTTKHPRWPAEWSVYREDVPFCSLHRADPEVRGGPQSRTAAGRRGGKRWFEWRRKQGQPCRWRRRKRRPCWWGRSRGGRGGGRLGRPRGRGEEWCAGPGAPEGGPGGGRSWAWGRLAWAARRRPHWGGGRHTEAAQKPARC